MFQCSLTLTSCIRIAKNELSLPMLANSAAQFTEPSLQGVFFNIPKIYKRYAYSIHFVPRATGES
jgi:hypothetical protein